MKKACIIGHPVAHSRSPLIHGYWLEQYGLTGSYDRIDIAVEELATRIRTLSDLGYVGGNCTIPHKEAMVTLCDSVSETAVQIGAVNTFVVKDGFIEGDNTDASGFLASLDQDVPDWSRFAERALVLGAGGAARAIVYGLLSRGVAEVYVANRTMARSSALAAQFGSRVFPVALDRIADLATRTGLVVNTTSQGMAGQPELEFDVAHLPDTAIVSDIVYVPLETGLITAARARGLRVMPGLGMLLHQAAPGFERWFGIMPTVSTALRVLVEDHVRNS